jgi:hypothetical protein
MEQQDSEIIDFSYALTSDLNLPLRVKLHSLEGNWPTPSFSDLLNDPFLRFKTQIDRPDLPITKEVYVTFQPFADNKR